MTRSNPATGEGKGRVARVAVQALIYSDTLSPEEISARLELQPTTTTEKGIKFGKRTGTRVDVPRHMWQLSSESHVPGQNFTDHLDWILAKLFAVRERLGALRKSGQLQSSLVGVVWTSGTSAHVQLSPRHAEMLAALQLELRLEFADYGDDD
jgi:uncharacterized protein DUF4279